MVFVEGYKCKHWCCFCFWCFKKALIVIKVLSKMLDEIVKFLLLKASI